MLGRSAAAAAVTGMLMACAGGAQALTKEPEPASAGRQAGAQNGCGNHEGGACGSIQAPAPAPPTASTK